MDTKRKKTRIEWNENPIVRVEATVMVRGEVGWIPHLGAGHSKVSIYESNLRNKYRIYGYKIQDRSVTLDALIPPRMQFTRASLIFHHWVIEDQRMGLAFNGTVDARAFDRGIRVAMESIEKARHRSSGSSTCSRTSDEPHSASPTSKQSFALPSSEHRSKTRTLPEATFRAQARSASSSLQRPVYSALGQRRHSSSVVGQARQSVASPSSPVCQIAAGEQPTSPFPANGSLSSTPGSTFKDPDSLEKKPFDVSPIDPDPRIHHHVTSERHRRQRRHRNDASSRTRRTKTPNLDNLERRRDSRPTKFNPYVQITSARKNTTVSFPPPRKESLGIKYSSSSSQCLVQSGGVDCHYRELLDNFSSDNPYHQTSLLFNSVTDNLKQPTLLHFDYEMKGGKRKEDLSERSRCRHCQTMFNHDKNRPGECSAAPPDSCQTCIECTSCMCLAHSVVHKCFPNSEGSYEQGPCSCSGHYNRGLSRRRWIVLAALSILVPCLCLYPVLKNCRKCGVACHYCGGRHEGMSTV